MGDELYGVWVLVGVAMDVRADLETWLLCSCFFASFIVRDFAGVSVELPSVNKLPLCTGGVVCGEVGD